MRPDIRLEMRRLTAGRTDFQRAFREVWEMPYVVVPQPKLRVVASGHWWDGAGHWWDEAERRMQEFERWPGAT